jgi:hypothetical protein
MDRDRPMNKGPVDASAVPSPFGGNVIAPLSVFTLYRQFCWFAHKISFFRKLQTVKPLQDT